VSGGECWVRNSERTNRSKGNSVELVRAERREEMIGRSDFSGTQREASKSAG
jgi:hypothetical protein